MFLDTTPSLPRPAHRLGLAVESHDPGAQPLPNGQRGGRTDGATDAAHTLEI
jgi:hypothetical protein